MLYMYEALNQCTESADTFEAIFKRRGCLLSNAQIHGSLLEEIFKNQQNEMTLPFIINRNITYR